MPRSWAFSLSFQPTINFANVSMNSISMWCAKWSPYIAPKGKKIKIEKNGEECQ